MHKYKTKMRDQKFIKTRERVMRYSVSDFIKAVHAFPQLWERHHGDYHNRDKRELAWQEVATRLYDKFDALSPTDKQKIVVMFTKRWKNTRDSFFRAQRRNRMLKVKKDEHPRAYIYEKEMSFLLHSKDNGNDEFDNEAGTDDNNEVNTNASISNEKQMMNSIKIEVDDDDVADNDDDDDDDYDDASNAPSRKKHCLIEKPILRVKKTHAMISCDLSDSDDILDINVMSMPLEKNREHSEAAFAPMAAESIQLKETKKDRSPSTSNKQPSRLTEMPNTEFDPDQSFFDSIKPVIRNMSMDQKLDFQIEVLKLLKDFRGKQ